MSIDRVTFSGSQLSGIGQNVVHFSNPDGVTLPAALFAYLVTNWINPMRASQNNNFTWLTCLIQYNIDSPGVSQSFPISPGAGTQAGDMAPPFVAGLLQIRTNTPGRPGRGRIYIPGMPINYFNTVGKLNSGAYTQFQTNFLNAWRTKFLIGGSAPVTLCVVPRVPVGSFAASASLATGIDVRQYASVQRRRNYFIGV